MACPDLEHIERFAEGVLSAEESAAFEKHLTECGACRGQLEQIRKNLLLARRVAGAELPKPPVESPKDAKSLGARQMARQEVMIGEQAGDQIGPYKLLSILGEGGFGIVWLAERQGPLEQRVALKIIKPGMDSKAVIARFEQERQALAVMDHPNVARVFDAGATPGGRLYFVMQYVQGEPITTYCDRHIVPIRQRLELFIPVCEAVQHAHMKGIIHRDIKPSNVLVSFVDGRPVPTVIDFGVAKAIAHTLTEKTIFTERGLLIGTPEYMSPEQAEMGALDVDTRTDVYSLGVLLYELLTGALPFDREFLHGKAFDEILRIIREVDPPAPSTKLTTSGERAAEIARQRQTPIDALARQLRSELEWIPMMAMRKDRTHRYDTPKALADDVRNYLAGRVLVAGPESATYRLGKWLRRHRGAVAAVASLMLVMVLGMAGTTLGLVEARDQRDDAIEARKAEAREAKRAITQLDKAERIAAFMEDILKGAGPSVALGRDTAMLREMMDAAAARITSGELKDAPEAELRLRLAIGNTDRQLAAFDEATDMLDAASALAESLAPASGESADVARALNYHGQLLFDLGRGTEAEGLFRQALEMYPRLFVGDHRDVAGTLNNLGSALRMLGRSAEAEPLLQQALDMNTRLFTGDHPEVAASLNNLAIVRQDQGRATEAEPLFQQALEMRQRLYEGDHPDVARSMNDLATTFLFLGRTAEAEPMFQQALEMFLRLLKGDHPDVARGLNNLASVRQGLGRAAEAEPLYLQALQMRQRLYKGDHPDVAVCLNNLASIRQELGRAAEAEPLFQQALEMNQRLFKGDHTDVARALNNLALVRQILGRVAEAEPLYLQALQMWQRLFKGDHPHVASCLSNLANVRQVQGRAAEAEPLFQQGLEMWQRLYPGDHPSVAGGLNNLATVRRALGRDAEAEPLIQQALEMNQRLFKGDHPEVALSLNNLASLRLSMGRPAEAEPLYQQSLEMHQRMYKADHPDVALSMSNLARVRLTLGRAADAEPLLRECLAMRERLFPDGSASAWTKYVSMSLLGQAVADQGRFAEAEPLVLTAFTRLSEDPRVPAPTAMKGSDYRRDALARIVKLYDAWHAAEPDKGYDVTAAEWRTKLEEK